MLPSRAADAPVGGVHGAGAPLGAVGSAAVPLATSASMGSGAAGHVASHSRKRSSRRERAIASLSSSVRCEEEFNRWRMGKHRVAAGDTYGRNGFFFSVRCEKECIRWHMGKYRVMAGATYGRNGYLLLSKPAS